MWSLTFGVVDLVFPQNHVFLECFDGEEAAIIFLADEVHFSERASSDYSDDSEVIHCDGARRVVGIVGEDSLRQDRAIGVAVSFELTVGDHGRLD
jgi:hypothetical protein